LNVVISRIRNTCWIRGYNNLLKEGLKVKFDLSLIQIGVTDGAKAEAFYCDVLGFEKDEHLSMDGLPVLKSASGIPVLLYTTASPSEFRYGEQAGPILVIGVDDIEAVYHEWYSKGVEFVPVPWSEEKTGIGECPFGRFIGFKDLDGNTHEIIQCPNKVSNGSR